VASDVAILAPVIFVAGLVRGTTGFAGPLIMVPVLGFFYSPASAVAISTLVDLSSNVSLLGDALRQASRITVASLIGGALLTIPFGGYALLAFDATVIARTMYAVVGFFSIVLLSGWRYEKALSPRQYFGVGAASGVILGATSFGVAVLPFLYSGADTAARGRANFILWALFCALIGFAIVLVGGRVGVMELSRALVLIPIYVAATWLGNRVAKRIDDAALRRIVLVVLLATAIAGLVVQTAQPRCAA
jgi:uncharacterized membrane protein YfcA